jgi:hypothetical protein
VAKKSDIVFGSEFSPSVVDLRELLELVDQHLADRDTLRMAIDSTFFPGKGVNADPRKTLGDNTIWSMIAYNEAMIARIDAVRQQAQQAVAAIPQAPTMPPPSVLDVVLGTLVQQGADRGALAGMRQTRESSTHPGRKSTRFCPSACLPCP